MKVLLVNGSPHKNGYTNRALEEVSATLEQEGIETETFWIGAAAVAWAVSNAKNSASA